ncbi:MAG: GNAT family N-acetyltransferase [Chloroflexi bacterium]|nr:GNAT family N-acetyltransferase [Chloroflexota bacterium]MBU1750852.1 GNAT family N-acetyltransferase [Chloroflexota bacterium]
MDEIRPFVTDDLDPFIAILANAYPGWDGVASEEGRERTRKHLLRLHEEVPTKHFHGLFRDDCLLGGMLLHDFRLNMHGTPVLAGGLGLVAVEFLHKKEHIARDMVAYFLRHYRERGAPIAMLYPFRPNFYEHMGFGWGTKMNQYRVLPAALPQGPSKAHVRYLGPDDAPALLGCYNRYASRTHGMIERYEPEVVQQLKNAQMRFVGYERDGQVQGYVVFGFEKGESFIVNDLHVRELVYENQAALGELLTFLHSQADQVRRIVLDTQDEYWHHVLRDPRNGTPEMIPSVFHESNVQGVGLMYRVLDTRRALELLPAPGPGAPTGCVRLTVRDSFVSENDDSFCLRGADGRRHLFDDGPADVEVALDIAHFSALAMGAVTFRDLYRYGLITVSDPAQASAIDALFAVPDKPICRTAF